MDTVRYNELIKMAKSGCKCKVRVKDIDDIAAVCVPTECGEYKDIETGIHFNLRMIDMCGKAYYIKPNCASDKRIYIKFGHDTWYFLPQWIDEVNQFNDDAIETCDEILI